MEKTRGKTSEKDKEKTWHVDHTLTLNNPSLVHQDKPSLHIPQLQSWRTHIELNNAVVLHRHKQDYNDTCIMYLFIGMSDTKSGLSGFTLSEVTADHTFYSRSQWYLNDHGWNKRTKGERDEWKSMSFQSTDFISPDQWAWWATNSWLPTAIISASKILNNESVEA